MSHLGIYRVVLFHSFVYMSIQLLAKLRGFAASNLTQRLDANYCTKTGIGHVHYRLPSYSRIICQVQCLTPKELT